MGLRFLIILGLLYLSSMALSEEQKPKPEQRVDNSNPTIDRSSHHHIEDPTYQGFWKKKFVWRPRWVKTWQEKKVYVAVWKRMWGPVEVKEWVPVPKPPPGWVKHKSGPYFVKVPH